MLPCFLHTVEFQLLLPILSFEGCCVSIVVDARKLTWPRIGDPWRTLRLSRGAPWSGLGSCFKMLKAPNRGDRGFITLP
jgi:hypothetical protein